VKKKKKKCEMKHKNEKINTEICNFFPQISDECPNPLFTNTREMRSFDGLATLLSPKAQGCF
jgi:hypothetical protein